MEMFSKLRHLASACLLLSWLELKYEYKEKEDWRMARKENIDFDQFQNKTVEKLKEGESLPCNDGFTYLSDQTGFWVRDWSVQRRSTPDTATTR